MTFCKTIKHIMANQSTVTLLQDIRRLLVYHRALGIHNYPATPALAHFLHTRPGSLPRSSRTRDSNTLPPRSLATPALADIREEMAGCTRCVLSDNRTHIVFGQGCGQPDVLIVAEWPSREDDRQAEAFCGPVGELLTKMLAAINLTRNDVFLTHIVKCLPPANRTPAVEEITTCLNFLHRQIEIMQPRVICTMGPLAACTLLRTDDSLFRLRGRFHEFQTVRGEIVPLLPTFHPDFLIKNPEMKKASWQDLQLLQKKVATLQPRTK
jgi:uracil-DNA glycosylase family 4